MIRKVFRKKKSTDGKASKIDAFLQKYKGENVAQGKANFRELLVKDTKLFDELHKAVLKKLQDN